MCEFKVEEHKMTSKDVRRIARIIVWENALTDLHDHAKGIVSVVLANDQFAPHGNSDMYWQPDMSHQYNDRHLVTDGQFARLVEEVTKQTERLRKHLKVDA